MICEEYNRNVRVPQQIPVLLTEWPLHFQEFPSSCCEGIHASGEFALDDVHSAQTVRVTLPPQHCRHQEQEWQQPVNKKYKIQNSLKSKEKVWSQGRNSCATWQHNWPLTSRNTWWDTVDKLIEWQQDKCCDKLSICINDTVCHQLQNEFPGANNPIH